MTVRPRILIVDDEESPREALRFILKSSYETFTACDGPTALDMLQRESFDLVLLDIKMPGMNGIEVLERIRHLIPSLPVVMVTAVPDARPAVQAMKIGAADYLNKPFDVTEIRLIVQRILDERLRDRVIGGQPPKPCTFESIIGVSNSMQDVYALMRRVLNTDTTVLILGETGTGKELVARALHYSSARKDGPFVPVHCAAIPGELLESELFGHEKGAFTGALQRRVGMFEAANGGTLFLDEVGEMPLTTQTKLLRAIQEREIRRVGSQETLTVNVRIVCSTNRDLQAAVRDGTFREDLFYRINVLPVTLPPLRERPEDIPQLVTHFSGVYATSLKRSVPQWSPTAMEVLERYPWPGNVRELEHMVERVLVTCDSDVIEPEQLPFVISQTETNPLQDTDAAMRVLAEASGGLEGGHLDLTKLTEDIERRAIHDALRQCGGVISEAARFLNITRRMLRYKMDKLGIPVKAEEDNEE